MQRIQLSFNSAIISLPSIRLILSNYPLTSVWHTEILYTALARTEFLKSARSRWSWSWTSQAAAWPVRSAWQYLNAGAVVPRAQSYVTDRSRLSMKFEPVMGTAEKYRTSCNMRAFITVSLKWHAVTIGKIISARRWKIFHYWLSPSQDFGMSWTGSTHYWWDQGGQDLEFR